MPVFTGRRDFLRTAVSVAATGPLFCRAQAVDIRSAPAVGEPVLEAPAEDSVGVAWSVSRLSTGAVEIADNPEMKNARTVKSGELPLACLDDRSLTVRVTGLKPATRYWYRTITQEVVLEHNRAGIHDLKLEDWNRFMDFTDAHGWRGIDHAKQ